MGASRSNDATPAALIDLQPPSSAETKALLALLPEFGEIGDPQARGRCTRVWAAAVRGGNWPDPRLAPTLPQVPIGPDTNLVSHTRRVMRACRDVGRAIGHAGVQPNIDELLEAAALHDVAKLIEYEPVEGGGFRLSDIGRSLPHAAIGAQWALAVGSPPSVARAIYVHTPSVGAVPETIEAVILFAVDQVDADASRMSAGAQPSTKRAMLGGATSR